jgi:tyrosyl-tRNA synthetase
VKFDFAQEIVARFHGPDAAQHAARDFVARFRDRDVPTDIPEARVAAANGGVTIVQALKQAGLTASTSEAMRMIEQGGVKLDGEKVSDKSLVLDVGAQVVLQVGRRKFARVTVA